MSLKQTATTSTDVRRKPKVVRPKSKGKAKASSSKDVVAPEEVVAEEVDEAKPEPTEEIVRRQEEDGDELLFEDAENDDFAAQRKADEIDRLVAELEAETAQGRVEGTSPETVPDPVPVPKAFAPGLTGALFRRCRQELDQEERPAVRREVLPPAPTGEAFRRRAAEIDRLELSKRMRPSPDPWPFQTPREEFNIATPPDQTS